MTVRFPHPVFQAPETGGAAPPAPAAGGSAAPGTSAAAAPPSGTAPPAPPEGPFAAYWNKDTNALDLDKASAAFIERDAVFTQHAERMKDVPAKPEDYKLVLPEDFKTPDGMKIEFDEKNPVVAEFRTIAKELSLPQASVPKLLSLQAKFQIAASQAAIAEHQQMVAAEVTKMGGEETYKARIAPIDTWVGAHFAPDEQAELRLIQSTEAGVRALEKLMKAANGSAMPGRVPDAPPAPPTQSITDRWYGGSERKAS